MDKTTTFMKNLVTLARATKEPVELVTKEGAVFKCFVEPEDDSTDKIVHHNLDDSWLEMLFKGKKKDGSKAESEDMKIWGLQSRIFEKFLTKVSVCDIIHNRG